MSCNSLNSGSEDMAYDDATAMEDALTVDGFDDVE